MDMDSSAKNIEDITEEDGDPVRERLDLNFIVNKDEEGEKNLRRETEVLTDQIQVHSNQEYPGSPMLPVGVDNEGMRSPIMKLNSADSSSPVKRSEEACVPIESDLDHNDVERTSDYSTEGRRSPTEDNQSHDRKEGDGELFDSNANEAFSNHEQSEDSYSGYRKPPPTIDSNNCDEVMGDEAFNHQGAKSPAFGETVNGGFGNAPVNLHCEKSEVNEEMDGGNSSHHTEMKEDDYSSVIVPSENGGMVWENSGLHSPKKTQDGSSSPERQLSISAERSPHHQSSTRKEELPSSTKIDRRSAPSPSSTRRKHSPSPERRSVGRRRASSRDRASPPGKPKSPTGRTTQRDSHRKDSSPRRRLSTSPRRRASRSPVRMRDSPGNRRDRRRRSRSRSPNTRDRSRKSPRRRHSPRRRSPQPSYPSRHRSPRRPWSPPANRNTGVGRPGNNLFIAGFSYVTTERDLEKKFARFGRVTDVRIVRDRRSGESRGFGFLSLERDEDADAAIRALDQTEWNGRIVLVEKSKTSTR